MKLFLPKELLYSEYRRKIQIRCNTWIIYHFPKYKKALISCCKDYGEYYRFNLDIIRGDNTEENVHAVYIKSADKCAFFFQDELDARMKHFIMNYVRSYQE